MRDYTTQARLCCLILSYTSFCNSMLICWNTVKKSFVAADFFLKNGVYQQSATTRPSQKSTALHAFRPAVEHADVASPWGSSCGGNMATLLSIFMLEQASHILCFFRTRVNGEYPQEVSSCLILSPILSEEATVLIFPLSCSEVMQVTESKSLICRSVLHICSSHS